MNKINSKEVQVSFNENYSSRTDDRIRKNEITHLEQKNSKLLRKDCLVYDLVKQSKENTFNVLSMKRKQKQKRDFKQGKIFINYCDFF